MISMKMTGGGGRFVVKLLDKNAKNLRTIDFIILLIRDFPEIEQ